MKNILLCLIIGVVLVGGGIFLYQNSKENTDPSSVVQSHRSYEVEMVSDLYNIQPAQVTKVAYKIKDEQGNILKDFDVVHERIMHVIVVRKDLQYFQHLHPEFDKTTGEFFLPVTFATDGEYRMFADFTPNMSQWGPRGERLPVTLFQEVAVGNRANYKPQPIGSRERTKTFDGHTITMSQSAEPLASQNDVEFTFEIKKDGKLVTNLEKYLGALGHTVVLREGDLQFIHAHATQKPADSQVGKVNFVITFPEAGNYKLFSQFQHEDKIITSDFSVSVIDGVKSSPDGTMAH
ncbi:MAG: hypothetical protein AAB579_04340 [Patescibacteria group bacterium]